MSVETGAVVMKRNSSVYRHRRCNDDASNGKYPKVNTKTEGQDAQQCERRDRGRRMRHCVPEKDNRTPIGTVSAGIVVSLLTPS